MAWYYGEFSCGHEGRVNIIGPGKDREWKKERAFEKMCPDCWEVHLKEERERKNREAEEKAKEMELPELTGSDKQIAWANTLRQKLIDGFERELVDYENRQIKSYYKMNISNIKENEIKQIRDYILENKTSSKFYIDNRYYSARDIIEKIHKEALRSLEELKEEECNKELIEEERIENTIFPEEKETETIAEITYTNKYIKVDFEKNDKFKEIVKELGYYWNSGWRKDITSTTGRYIDRAAELANNLLAEGFAVRVPNKEIKEKAISGEFEQECTRWIYARVRGDYKGSLAIGWRGFDKNLYNIARKLPKSRWDRNYVIVEIEYYDLVEEFAELYGFKFTDKAKELIEEYKMKSKNINTVDVEKKANPHTKDGLKDILESKEGILDDLKD